MQLKVAGTMPASLRGSLRRLLVGDFALLALFIMAAFVHSAYPSGGLYDLAEGLGIILATLSVATLLVGVGYAWWGFPQHRRVVAIVVGVTAATLLAHLYVVGSPSAGTQGTASGAVGSTFGDGKVTVSSSVSGQTISVSVTAEGNAIASLNVSSGGSPLVGVGFANPPTYASPLQPSSTATGTWRTPAGGNGSNIEVTYEALTCYSTSSHSYGCIMDEVFYVPEAMGILAGQHCSTTGSNCHMEHPPLASALIASGMAAFGEYNSAAWRIMPVLLGTFSIPVLFGIAWKVSGSKQIAAVASVLLALDVMFFSQSSGALLDIPETFFGLLGLFAYVANLKWWKFDRVMIAGVFLGIAALSKETAIFMAVALGAYVLFLGEGSRSSRFGQTFKLALVVALVFSAGLQAYDSALATPAVPTFNQQISYMLSYGSSLVATKLACQPTTGYWCKNTITTCAATSSVLGIQICSDPRSTSDAGGPAILPFDWLLTYSPVAYYATSVDVCPNSVNGTCQGGQYSYVALAYYGVTNMIETWTVYIWVPLVAYLVYKAYRSRQPNLDQFGFEAGSAPRTPLSPELKYGALALVWFLGNYLPYILLFFYGRVTYPFYFVPAIPAVAMGAGFWLTRSWFPKWLMYIFLVMAFVFFFIYFPSKGFLPDWLRVLIGR